MEGVRGLEKEGMEIQIGPPPIAYGWRKLSVVE